MKSNLLFNSLIGTYYSDIQYYTEAYGIYRNSLQKEGINNLTSLKDDDITNFINENKNIKQNAFCINYRKNININENLNCKTHNIKYIKNLIIDIDIKILEINLKNIIKNYKKC